MAKQTNTLKKKLQKILENQEFEKLSTYRDSKKWPKMKNDERELLGILFVNEGEKLLETGDNLAHESLETATKVAPKSLDVHFRQALAYSSQYQNLYCLSQAVNSLQKIIEIEPNFGEGWFLWGKVLMNMGKIQEDTKYFEEADHKLQKAIEKIKKKIPEIYWNWGLCWYYHGQISEEPYEFRCAIDKFEQISDFSDSDFFVDYGNVLLHMGVKIGNIELLFEAVDKYRKALRINSSNFNGWQCLAICFKKIYESEGYKKYFTFSNDCFEHAQEIFCDCNMNWFEWGQLLSLYGKRHKDIEKLHKSLEKFEKAEQCDTSDPYTLTAWADAEMIYGSYTDQLHLLYQAEEKLIRSVQLKPNETTIWYIYGNCCCEFGRYFSDIGYYKKAFEKFDQGLKINPNDSLCLYGLATANFSLGEFTGKVEYFEKAAEYCEKVNQYSKILSLNFWNDWGISLLKLALIKDKKEYVVQAIEKFERAISQQSHFSSGEIDPEWLYNYGNALDLLGDFEESPHYYQKAIQTLAKAIQIDPTFLNARYSLALALYHLGDITGDVAAYQKSIEQFQTLLHNENEDDQVWCDYGLTILSMAFLVDDPAHRDQVKRLQKDAENKFQKSIALGSTQAYYYLACLYSMSKNFSAAYHYLEKAKYTKQIPDKETLIKDPWLENLHRTQEFVDFINRL